MYDGRAQYRELQKIGENDRTKIEFVYNGTFRRLEQQNVTTLGGSDGTVQAITYKYDSLGRVVDVTSHTDSDPDTTNFADALNQVEYVYNDLGLLDKQYQEHEGAKDGNTLYVGYTYDTAYDTDTNEYTAGMRLKSVTYPNGRLEHYTYGSSGGVGDLLSRLAAIKDDATGTDAGTPGATVASYGYNGLGRLVVEDFEEPDVRLDHYNDYNGNPTAGVYEGFDQFGRVTGQVWRDYTNNAYRDRYGYGYDRNSNRLYRENLVSSSLSELYFANDATANTEYDGLNRLKEMRRGTLVSGNRSILDANTARHQSFTLDGVGNWSAFKDSASGTAWDLEQTRTHNLVNEITDVSEGSGQAAWVSPVHDARGNMTTIPKPTDLDDSYTGVYDAWNRLVEVKTVGQSPVTVGKYEFDGLNHRTKSHIDTAAPDAPDGVDIYRHFYYNAGWQLLETRRSTSENSDPETLGAAVKSEWQFVWSARYIDAPVLRDRNNDLDNNTGSKGKSGSGLDERLYYTTDANMNVTALINTDGTVAERYRYDAYGNVTTMDADWTVDSTPDYDNPILYCGYYRDAETGLYNVRNRVYHAQLGRWVQRDPAGYVDGLALYEYASSCPVHGADFLGLSMLSLTGPPAVQEFDRRGPVGFPCKATVLSFLDDIERPEDVPIVYPWQSDPHKGDPEAKDPRTGKAPKSPGWISEDIGWIQAPMCWCDCDSLKYKIDGTLVYSARAYVADLDPGELENFKQATGYDMNTVLEHERGHLRIYIKYVPELTDLFQWESNRGYPDMDRCNVNLLEFLREIREILLRMRDEQSQYERDEKRRDLIEWPPSI